MLYWLFTIVAEAAAAGSASNEVGVATLTSMPSLAATVTLTEKVQDAPFVFAPSVAPERLITPLPGLAVMTPS